MEEKRGVYITNPNEPGTSRAPSRVVSLREGPSRNDSPRDSILPPISTEPPPLGSARQTPLLSARQTPLQSGRVTSSRAAFRTIPPVPEAEHGIAETPSQIIDPTPTLDVVPGWSSRQHTAPVQPVPVTSSSPVHSPTESPRSDSAASGDSGRSSGSPQPASSRRLSRRSSHRSGIEVLQHRYRGLCRRLGIIPRTHFLKQLGRKYISLRDERLDRKELYTVCSALVRDRHVTTLDMARNNLNEKTMAYIVELCKKNPRVQELILSECQLDEDSLYKLLEVLENSKEITKLCLRGNKLSDNDGVVLSEILTGSPGLTHVDLSHNNLRDRGAIQLGDAINRLHRVTHLDLSWNNIRGRGAECIALGLMHNDSLKYLNVSWNGFGVEGCIALSHGLRCNSTLEELDLSCNRISSTGILKLFQSTYENNTLRILRVGHNHIPASVTSGLLCVLKEDKDLTLDLLDLSRTVVDLDFESVLKIIQDKKPDFKVIYERAMPIFKGSDLPPLTEEQRLRFEEARSDPVFNVDPVRVLYYNKKDMRAMDLFNLIDENEDARLSRQEINDGLKRYGFPLSSGALDKLMTYLDTNGDGEVDLGEFLDGWRRYRREVLEEKQEFMELERLAVEVGDGSDVRGDAGGIGGRFSQTFRGGPIKKESTVKAPNLPAIGSGQMTSQQPDNK